MTGQATALDPNASIYYGPQGEKFSLGQELGAGGEARVYEVFDDPGLVAKIYNKNAESRRAKLEAMLSAAPVDPARKRNIFSICWPEELLNDRSGVLAGFLMPRLDVKTFHPAAFLWNAEDRKSIAPDFTWRHMCVAAANIASVVDLIHSKGHVIGDLNDENFLLNDRGLASVVDCDSMQILCPQTGQIYRSTVGREPYTSPQLLGKTLRDVDRCTADDCWALAILIFSLLLEGHHPCNGVGTPEERGIRIRRGIFPFLGEASFSLPQYALPATILPAGVQALLYQCLRTGHSDPSKRPSAAAWRHELSALPGQLLQCDESSMHWYSPHLAACPWCEEKKRHGIDRFPAESTPTNPAAPVTVASTVTIGTSVTPAPPPRKGRIAIWLALAAAALIIFFAIWNPHSGTGYSAASSFTPSTYVAANAASVSGQSSNSEPSSPAQTTSTATNRAPQFAAAANPSEATAASSGSAVQAVPQTETSQAQNQAQSASMETFQRSTFAISYPSTWTVIDSGENNVFLCQTNGVIRRADGSPWCYYSIIVSTAPTLAEVMLQAGSNLAAQKNLYKTFSQSEWKTQNTSWGPSVFATLQGVTPYDYTEIANMWIVTSPKTAFIQADAPSDQWSAALPVLQQIINSLRFQ